jgi:hypothetical protein
MGCKGKWMQLEDTMLIEVSQVQKHKRHVFSHMWKIDPKLFKEKRFYKANNREATMGTSGSCW